MGQHLSVEARRPQLDVPLLVQGSSAGLGWQGLFSAYEEVLATPEMVEPPVIVDEMVVLHRSTGTMRWREDGRSSIEHVAAGSVHLVPSNVLLDIGIEQNMQTQSILLGREVLLEVASEFVRGDPDKIRLRHAVYSPPAEQTLLYDSIGAAFLGRGPGSAIYAEYAARAVAAQLLVAWSAEQGRMMTFPPRRGRSRTVAQAIDFMHANLGTRLTLQMIARAAGVSITVLGREFRADLGVAPHGALIDMRLDQAQHLLKLSKSSLPDIAAQCGFSSQEHMTRLFRNRLRMTPGAYRRTVAG